jgi:hypothetical protein
MLSSRRLRTVVVALLLSPLIFASSASATQAADRSGTASVEPASVTIPGPLRAFLRMAGISQKVTPEQVMPLLARNVFVQGYRGTQSKSRPTEFLILLTRYVQQARELSGLAGPDGTIHISDCQQAQPLLQVLGYRTRLECGHKDTSLVTADPERAFLTIDSGFPLSELEETLQGGKAFSYVFPSSRVPVLFTEREWASVNHADGKSSQNLLDELLRAPLLARLYWALSRGDPETTAELRQHPGLQQLLPVAGVLDFYGAQICVRAGRVVVPGGPAAEEEWKALVGVSPESPDQFIPRLLAKDRGWLAAFFDALSRVGQQQQAHFTLGKPLRRYYEAFREADPSEDASRATFRPAPDLLVFLARTRWEANGEPLVPGNLQVWSQILRQKTDSKVVRDWGKRAVHWDDPEQLLEAMFAFSRQRTFSGPLPTYLTLSEIDSRRPSGQRLSPPTVLLLSNKFAQFSDQYRIFAEFSNLDDASISRFVNVAESLTRISNHALRGDAMGIFQANIGLWQILARQGQISSAAWNDSWMHVVSPFATVSSPGQLFDAAQNSLGALVRATNSKSSPTQDEIVDLLAGPAQNSEEGRRIHEESANHIRSILDDQRLVSLDTLLALGTGLDTMARGRNSRDSLASRAGELREFEMPRPIFTGSERTEWAVGIYNNRHTDLEMKTDIAKVLKSSASPAQLQEARGQLTPFLRDTLVGLNYAYYEPPGAQILHYNPLFVRSHDFSGDTIAGIEQIWQAPRLFGEGSPAGGGARLVGSLADLPYVLAQVEQDFISPENVQALIWREVVPGLVISSTLPRWWRVTPHELHAITLYQKSGEELLTASTQDDELRGRVISILSDRMTPQSVERLRQALGSKHLVDAISQITPADTFYLAAQFRERFPEAGNAGPASTELTDLSSRYPAELAWDRLSQDFGVPHPILSQRYSPELLNLKPLPALSGYSSRLLAETWDSSNLYWARLADEQGLPPVTLNLLVPQLTHRMIEKIFATDQEDWTALLRAMRETGEEFRAGKIATQSANSAALRN